MDYPIYFPEITPEKIINWVHITNSYYIYFMMILDNLSLYRIISELDKEQPNPDCLFNSILKPDYTKLFDKLNFAQKEFNESRHLLHKQSSHTALKKVKKEFKNFLKKYQPYIEKQKELLTEQLKKIQNEIIPNLNIIDKQFLQLQEILKDYDNTKDSHIESILKGIDEQITDYMSIIDYSTKLSNIKLS